MWDNRGVIINLIILIVGYAIIFLTVYLPENNKSSSVINDVTIKHESEAELLLLELNIDNYLLALEYYNIKNPNKVLAQALWETGHFQSYNCRVRNNTLGLYNSKRKNFYEFSHWTQSIRLYKTSVEYKLKDGEDYYKFLERIGYAEDPTYVTNIKGMVNNLKAKGLINIK